MSTEGGEESASSIYHTQGSCGLTVRPGPVTSACTTLGFLPVPYTLTLSICLHGARKGKRFVLQKVRAPHRRGQCTPPVLNPRKQLLPSWGAVTCHILSPATSTSADKESRWPLPNAWLSPHHFPPPSAQFMFCLSFEREALMDAYL